MKRVLALVLVTLLILSLSACSGVKLTDPEEIGNNTSTTMVKDTIPDSAPDFGEFLAEEEEKRQQEELELLQKLEEERLRKQEEERKRLEEERKKQEEELKAQEEARIAKEEKESIPPRQGTIENGVYTNDYIGLIFAPRFGFVFYNREEMGELVGQDPEVYSVKNLASANSEVDSIYEMMAVDLKNNNVIICYENLGKSGFYCYTEAQYLRSVYMAMAEDPNYTCDWEGRGAQKLGGVEFQMLQATVQINGQTMTQGFYIKKYGKYFVQIIITAAPDAYATVVEDFAGI